MSEAPQDIPFVKILKFEVVTPEVSSATGGLWLNYEVVNMGTAAATDEISVSAHVSIHGGQVDYQDVPLAGLAADGGSTSGTYNFRMETFRFEGEWRAGLQVNLGVNKGINDSAEGTFTVHLEDV